MHGDIHVYHGGVFVNTDTPDMQYINAIEEIFWNQDLEFIGIFGFFSCIRSCGYRVSPVGVWYTKPGMSLSSGRFDLKKDTDVIRLREFVRETGITRIDVYVEHLFETHIDVETITNLSEWGDTNEEEGDYESDPDNDNEGVMNDVTDLTDIPVVTIDWVLNDDECPSTPIASDDDATYCLTEQNVEDGDSFSLLQMFNDAEEFKSAVEEYSIKNHRAVKFDRSNKARVQVICCDKKCPYRIWCSTENKFHKFQIKAIEDIHTCSKTSKSPLCDSRWLAKKFLEKFRRNSNFKAADLRAECLNTFGISVSLAQCFRAKQKALRKIQGNQPEHFAKLRQYENELLRSNRGSTILIQTDNENPYKPIFQRMYVGFEALRKGWIGNCRPIIGLDGAFLKWFVKGEILSAVGRDANNQMFPIAWAVVEVENTDSWMWFIKLLMNDLKIINGDGLTLVTDGQKGLLRAISELVPNAKHRICARHVYANWRKRFKQPELKPKFWAVAKAYTNQAMKRALDEVKKISADAASDLLGSNMEAWCMAYFSDDPCSDVVHNNMSESFNSAIRQARSKPIINMFEDIRIATMERMALRLHIISGWEGLISPKAQKEIDSRIEKSLYAHVIPNGRQQWEVHQGGEVCVVDMIQKTCACRVWRLSGIPCWHALAVILRTKSDVVDYVSPYYSKAAWEKAYNDVLSPINGENMWEISVQPDILPPVTRKMPGRPKRNRRKDPTESPSKKRKATRHGRVIKCGHCLQPGHNKSGCSKRKAGDPAAQPIPRLMGKLGRPRTNTDAPSSSTNKVSRKRREKNVPSQWNLLPERRQENRDSNLDMNLSAP